MPKSLSNMDGFIKSIDRKKDYIDRGRMTGRDNIAETMKKILDLSCKILKGTIEMGEGKQKFASELMIFVKNNNFDEEMKNLQSEYNDIGVRINEINREINRVVGDISSIDGRNNQPEEPGLFGAVDRFFTNVDGAF